MKRVIVQTWVAVIAGVLLIGPAYALTLNDPGVAGTVEAGTQNSSVDNEVDWANYILSLGANAVTTADGNVPTDGVTENYKTSSTDYNGTLTGGTQVGGGVLDPGSYEYVLVKYDGQNAGYVLFYVPDMTGDIPEYSYSIWGNNTAQYQISHYTGFGHVPDGGATLMLLGAALGGLGIARRFMKV